MVVSDGLKGGGYKFVHLRVDSIEVAEASKEVSKTLSTEQDRSSSIEENKRMDANITLLNLMAFICCAWCAVPLYPYGPGAGDSRLINSADPAATIILRESYMFFGEDYTHVCVSYNNEYHVCVLLDIHFIYSFQIMAISP